MIIVIIKLILPLFFRGFHDLNHILCSKFVEKGLIILFSGLLVKNDLIK